MIFVDVTSAQYFEKLLVGETMFAAVLVEMVARIIISIDRKDPDIGLSMSSDKVDRIGNRLTNELERGGGQNNTETRKTGTWSMASPMICPIT